MKYKGLCLWCVGDLSGFVRGLYQIVDLGVPRSSRGSGTSKIKGLAGPLSSADNKGNHRVGAVGRLGVWERVVVRAFDPIKADTLKRLRFDIPRWLGRLASSRAAAARLLRHPSPLVQDAAVEQALH
jgi:hypothetical protein